LARETQYNRRYVRASLSILAAAAVALAGAAAAGRSLAETLAKMDEAAAQFKGFSANVEHVHHMDAIHEDETDSGTILVKRPKPKDLHVRIEFVKPDPKVAVIDGSKVEVYYPHSGEIDRYDLGRRRSLLDMFVAQGFGGTSRDLQRDYTVKLGGAETVAGESATRLELIPKAAEMLEQWKRVDLWISDKSGNTLQQKLYENGKDYHLITYTNIKLNPEIPDSAFKLEVPKGTKREILIKK
jgi:outer membrane lipoprotein-sorting protein